MEKKISDLENDTQISGAVNEIDVEKESVMDSEDQNINKKRKHENGKGKEEERKEIFNELLHPEEIEVAEELQLHDEEVVETPKQKLFSRIMNLTTIIIIIVLIVLSIIGYKKGIFTNQESLINFVKSLGPGAPFVFVLIQAVQVVIPILPAAIGCAVGVIAFGPWIGLLYNYIGISIGSIAAFMLSRKYGKPFVIRMIGAQHYKKYIGWTSNSKKYERILAFLIFIPVAPDDILCYITGLTDMTLKKFSAIILLCKPFSISLYSLGLTMVITNLFKWLTGLAR